MANLMAKCPYCNQLRTWCRGGNDPGCNCRLQHFKDPRFDESIKSVKEDVKEEIEEVKEEFKKKRRRNWDIPIDDEVGDIIPVEGDNVDSVDI